MGEYLSKGYITEDRAPKLRLIDGFEDRERLDLEDNMLICTRGKFHPKQLEYIKSDKMKYLTVFNELSFEAQLCAIAIKANLNLIDYFKGKDTLPECLLLIDEIAIIDNWMTVDWKVVDVIDENTFIGKKKLYNFGVTIKIEAVVSRRTRNIIEITSLSYSVDCPLNFNEIGSIKLFSSHEVYYLIRLITREMYYRDFHLGVEAIRELLITNRDNGVTGRLKYLDNDTIFIAVDYLNEDDEIKTFMTYISNELKLKWFIAMGIMYSLIAIFIKEEYNLWIMKY